MANTYSQIYLHYVFAVHDRGCVIMPEWKDELYKYIGGIIANRGQKMLAIGGTRDHVHVFVNMSPSMSSSDLKAEVKRASSIWINDKKLVPGKFAWQEGYGAFSYALSQIDNVVQYIKNQEKHHQTRTFRDEYIAILRSFQVDFDPRYIFAEV